MRAFVVGESHTVCLSEAALAEPEQMYGISIHRFANKRTVAGDDAISVRESVDLVAALPPHVPVFLSVLGTRHNILGLVRHEITFDFLSCSEDIVDDIDVLEIIPWRVMADIFDFHVASSNKYLSIAKAAKGPVFLISSPPPKGDNDFIIQKFAKAHKQTYHGQNVIDIGLNTPRLRKKMWQLECQRSQIWAQENGIEYLNPPEDVFDRYSFLKECYYDDVTHANRGYGGLVLRQILDVVKKQEENVTHG